MSEERVIRLSLRVPQEEDPALYAILSQLSSNHMRRRNQILQMLRSGAGLLGEGVAAVLESQADEAKATGAISPRGGRVSEPSREIESRPVHAPVELDADDLSALLALSTAAPAPNGA